MLTLRHVTLRYVRVENTHKSICRARLRIRNTSKALTLWMSGEQRRL